METTTTDPTTEAPARASRVRPIQRTPRSATRPTLPATDAADSAAPLTLSADAMEGTRDRLTAFEWTEAGHLVRKREDGVYERLQAAPGPKPAEPEHYEYYPNVEILDRRMLDPSLRGETSIKFKDEISLPEGAKPLYYKRWVDTWVPSRLLTLTQRGGYLQAEWTMLANENEIADRHKAGTDKHVRRGDKGQYMLLFMPYVRWEAIKMRQAQIRTERERASGTSIAASLAGKSPKEGGLGDGKAGDQIASAFTGSVRELPPVPVEALEASGIPRDLRPGSDAVAPGSAFDE